MAGRDDFFFWLRARDALRFRALCRFSLLIYSPHTLDTLSTHSRHTYTYTHFLHTPLRTHTLHTSSPPIPDPVPHKSHPAVPSPLIPLSCSQYTLPHPHPCPPFPPALPPAPIASRPYRIPRSDSHASDLTRSGWSLGPRGFLEPLRHAEGLELELELELERTRDGGILRVLSRVSATYMVVLTTLVSLSG